MGDTVRVGVHQRGQQGARSGYEGVVIASAGGNYHHRAPDARASEERVFMLHSPQVASIKVERRGKVRRAKLFYLRERVGKATRVKSASIAEARPRSILPSLR